MLNLPAIARFLMIVCLICVLDRPMLFANSAPVSETDRTTDFVDFWAASRLLISGGNPFSPAEVLELQQSVGYRDPKPLLMWNPPWTLSFILPIGVLDYELSELVWLVLNIFFILLSARKLWEIYIPTAQQMYWPLIAAFTFVPTLMVLIIGQITPLVLLGLVGFLYFERKNQLVWAGASTTLISIKPHLVYLFWIGLILWIWKQRHWKVALGATLAGAVVAVVPALIDPAVYSQFIEMYRSPGRSTPFELPAPSVGSFLPHYLPNANLLIQFLPPLLGSLWFLWQWYTHQEEWDWIEQFPIMILVSLVLSPYAWTYDQIILLPAVIHGVAMAKQQPAWWYKYCLAILYIGTNGCYFVGKLFATTDSQYFWLAPAFLLIYLGARAGCRGTTAPTPAMP